MKELTKMEIDELLLILKERFEKNIKRHPNIKWENVYGKLFISPLKMISLKEMEDSGGEPDIIDYDAEHKEYIYCDCSKETPVGRRNCCYDKKALDARKQYKPETNAIDLAQQMGIKILDEAEYRSLQEKGEFDLKTSSWLMTPESIRNLGGAIFGDRRYDCVFIYHNGADSYYGVRGFRGILRV
jgi:hypothetical protein